MALEQDVIIDKLKDEGINEKLGTGLNFETEGDLNSWVEDFKNAIPEPSKKLEEYTREELEELAKDPEFKGAKGLQSFIDSVRAKSKSTSKKEQPQKEPVKSDTEPEWAKRINEKLEKLEGKQAKEAFDVLVKRISEQEGLKELHINRMKKGLSPDATEDDVKNEIKAYKSELVALGLKEFGTPGSGSKSSSTIQTAAKKWAEKEKKKKINK